MDLEGRDRVAAALAASQVEASIHLGAIETSSGAVENSRYVRIATPNNPERVLEVLRSTIFLDARRTSYTGDSPHLRQYGFSGDSVNGFTFIFEDITHS